MTNKPMLSVELIELLNRVVDPYRREPRSICLHNADIAELRALLDKPDECRCKRYGKDNPHWPCPVHAEPVAQHQGEPVALQHIAVSEGGVLRWMTGRNMQDCELYAMPDGSAIRSKLYAEQPAPVAVVMPERQIVPDNLMAGLTRKWCEGWNDALEGVARLNGVNL